MGCDGHSITSQLHNRIVMYYRSVVKLNSHHLSGVTFTSPPRFIPPKDDTGCSFALPGPIAYKPCHARVSLPCASGAHTHPIGAGMGIPEPCGCRDHFHGRTLFFGGVCASTEEPRTDPDLFRRLHDSLLGALVREPGTGSLPVCRPAHILGLLHFHHHRAD